jgi:hypothetical protein
VTYPQLAYPVPVHSFLVLLAMGWNLPWIVEPCDVGSYSVILWREE